MPTGQGFDNERGLLIEIMHRLIKESLSENAVLFPQSLTSRGIVYPPGRRENCEISRLKAYEFNVWAINHVAAIFQHWKCSVFDGHRPRGNFGRLGPYISYVTSAD